MPGTSKKVVRKVRTARVADFDDQMWPINCAILILAGFATGIAIATGDWHAENLLYNTVFRLVLIAVAVAVVFVAMLRLQRKMIRRVQLCVLISLLAHLWLGLVLHQQYIAFVAARQEGEAARRLVEEDPRLIVPEYHWENIERPESRHTFEEPVATEAPKATEPEPIEPKQLEHDVPADKKPRTEPSPPQPQQPNPAEVRRAELTAPRRAPLAAGAQISRQEWKHLLEPNEPIPEPAAPPRVEEAAAESAAASTVEPRRAEAPRHEREMSESVPRALTKQDAMKLARRAAPAEPLPDAPTTPTPTRQLTRPADVAQTDLTAPPPAAPVATPPATRLTPTPSEFARRATAAASEPSPGRELPAMTPTARLPASAARRAEASLSAPTPERLAASRPSTLQRAQTGIDLPAAAMPAPSATASPAATGGAPGSRIEATGPLAVTRTTSNAPTGNTVAAAGAAEFAIGSSPATARRGQPRAVGAGEPSMASSTSPVALARSTASGTALSATPVPAAMPAPEGTPAASAGAALRPTANARATAAVRGGSVSIPTDRPTAASGPLVASSGTPGQIGVAQLARVTRHESIASGISGGGTPSPARALGRAIAPKATVDAPQVPATAAVEGKAGGSPLEAPTGAQPRQVTGLPGSLPAQAMAGAVASLSEPGSAAPTAAARCAAASQSEPGGADSSPNTGTTVARSERGTHLPSMMATLPELPKAGAAGLAATPGGAPSRLEEGATTAVRRAAGAGVVGGRSVAAGAAEFDVGSSPVATAAGMFRPADDGVPNLAADNTVRVVGRTTVSGDSARDAAPTDALATVPVGASADSRGDSAGVAGSPAPPSDALASEHPTAELPGELAADRAVAEARIVGPSATTPGAIAGPRRLPRGDDPGPALAAETSGGPLRKTNSPGLLRGIADAIDARPGTAAGTDEATPRPEAAGVAGAGAAMRQPGGLPIEIAAKTGAGGLSYEPSPQVGIPNRHARPESEVVHTLSRRFLVARSGGRVAIDGQVQELPAEAFRRRDPGQRARAIEIYGGTEGTERAVEMGLEFFVRCQFPDGHWSLDKLPETVAAEQPGLGRMGSDSAATGLALLSFLGAGYTHQSDKHRATVRRGLDWLAGHQKPDGDLFTGGSDYTWFYSHGIATIALCEAYGMTRDPQLREPAQKAVQFIVDSQSPSRGGWRYEPREETDTSVSGWQLMALKSAQMAGLKVPKETLDRVSGWLDAAQSNNGARYAYNPYAGDTPTQLPGRRPNLAMTAEGALMRMYLGWKSDNPALVDAADHLKENLPEVGTAERPTRDAYYWYYATQVMFQMRGDYWEAWNNRLSPLLESSQEQTGSLSGSWNPDAPIRDRWAHAGGRVYVTAMHLLMLEVYYRHLPLFQPLEE